MHRNNFLKQKAREGSNKTGKHWNSIGFLRYHRVMLWGQQRYRIYFSKYLQNCGVFLEREWGAPCFAVFVSMVRLGQKEQSSGSTWSDVEDLLVGFCGLLEPVTSHGVKHTRLVDTDTEPNSRKTALSILVRRINRCRLWQLPRGDKSKHDEQREKKISSKCEGPKASHKKWCQARKKGAVACLVSKKRLTWKASQKIKLPEQCCSTTRWGLYGKHLRQLVTKVLLRH